MSSLDASILRWEAGRAAESAEAEREDRPTALITGASRGIGFELVRGLARAGFQVVATCRSPERASALRRFARRTSTVSVLRLDVVDSSSVSRCATDLNACGTRIDLLVNNAGIWDVGRAKSIGPLRELDPPSVLRVIETNAVGALSVIQGLYGCLAPDAVIANMSSALASGALDVPRINLAYAMSKAALNVATRQLASELAGTGKTVVALDPGWVRTDLGGRHAPLSSSEAVAGLVSVLTKVDQRQNGCWIGYLGNEVKW